MGGFQLLGLSDFPGQGTALVGVLDAFWEEKGYVTPAEFRRFCNSTVPLARLARRVFTSEEHLVAGVEVAHFGASPIIGANATWRLIGDDNVVPGGQPIRPPRCPYLGSGNTLGTIDVALGALPAPARCKLVVSLEGTPFQNDWDVLGIPAGVGVPTAAPAGVIIAERMDAETQARLEVGAAVVLMLPPESVQADPARGRIALGFSSIFWNTAWTKGQAPHGARGSVDPGHSALSSFPTDAFSNWQWWYPCARSPDDPRRTPLRPASDCSGWSTTGSRTESWPSCSRPAWAAAGSL